MRQINEFLKGLCIGVANVIPGFCSGLMAIILKVYDEYLDIFGEIFIHPFKVTKKHYAMILGILLGVVVAVFSILTLIENYPIPTVLFFVGLIIGTIPDSYKEITKLGKLKISDYLLIVISSIILVFLSLLKPSNVDVTLSFSTIIITFLLGIITSIAMIIPGVSGSLILMSLGYYVFIMNAISTLIKNIIVFEFSYIFNDFAIVATFISGAIIGLIYITKAINVLFDKHPKITHSIIFGLIIASPFSAIYRVVIEYKDALDLNNPMISIIGSLLLIIAVFISGILPKIINKNK